MARKYSSWALSNDFNRMKLTTVNGNEQDQLKQFDRVEAIPHMYINVDAPPAPISSAPISIIRTDSHAFQPKLNASFVSVPNSTGGSAKLWPADRSSVIDSASSSSKRRHKHHHHHHHHHHGDKHHHHHRRRHHSRHHRAKSAESIRNRVQPTFLPVESQPQQMVVYREGYPPESNPTSLATVPYMTNEQETSYVDDQQTPMIVYRDTPSIIQSDGTGQQYFYHPEQETKHLQTIENKLVSHHVNPSTQTQVVTSPPCLCVPTAAPSYIEEIERFYLEDDCCQVPSAPIQHSCIVQQAEPPSQFVYCTEPAMQHNQEYLCTSPSSVIQSQPQFICMDNLQSVAQQTSATIQPTMINQIPVFNTAASAPSLQRTTSVVLPQQVIQSAPAPAQLIQVNSPPPAQYIQVSSPTSAQVIQAVPAPMIQMPMQTVAAAPSLTTSPQILYQRPYDQMVVPIQNQTVALAANPQPMIALSQPSYAPARLATVTAAPTANANNPGPNMFRHALLRTVADRAGVPVPTANVIAAPMTAGNVQLVQGTPNLQGSSLPIVPLTPGGLLIPFQPNLNAGRRSGPFPRLGGYPSSLKNFQDIRQQIDQRAQILSQMSPANRVPSPPVLSTGSAGRTNYQSPPSTTGSLLSPANSGPYGRTGLNYSPPSLAGSITSGQTNPYRIVRP